MTENNVEPLRHVRFVISWSWAHVIIIQTSFINGALCLWCWVKSYIYLLWFKLVCIYTEHFESTAPHLCLFSCNIFSKISQIQLLPANESADRHCLTSAPRLIRFSASPQLLALSSHRVTSMLQTPPSILKHSFIIYRDVTDSLNTIFQPFLFFFFPPKEPTD